MKYILSLLLTLILTALQCAFAGVASEGTSEVASGAAERVSQPETTFSTADLVGRWVESTPAHCASAEPSNEFRYALNDGVLSAQYFDATGALALTRTFKSVTQSKLDALLQSVVFSGTDVYNKSAKKFTLFYTSKYTGDSLLTSTLIVDGVKVIDKGALVEKHLSEISTLSELEYFTKILYKCSQ